MRWNNLFDDLEGQLEQELAAEEVDLRAEEERLRIGRLSLRERLMAVSEARGDAQVHLTLASAESLQLRPITFGKDWFAAVPAGDTTFRVQFVVPLAAVVSIELNREQIRASVTPRIGEEHHSLSARLTLPFVLRDLCRRRSAVTVRLAAGMEHGTIDRVGRDHVDLAIHEPGTPRREKLVTSYRVIPLTQVLFVKI